MKKKPTVRLIAGMLLLALTVLALLSLTWGRVQAQATATTTATATSAPATTSTATSAPATSAALTSAEVSGISVTEAQPGSGSARLLINISRRGTDWPDLLLVTVTLPDGIELKEAERDRVPIAANPGSGPNEQVFSLDPTTGTTQVLSLQLAFMPDAGDGPLTPLQVRLRDPASGAEAPVSTLPQAQLDQLEAARPESSGQEGPAQQATDEPGAGDEPAETTEPAATDGAGPIDEGEAALTDEPAATEPAATEPAATAALPPPTTPTVTPVAIGPDDDGAGLGVSDVLLIVLIAGLALFFAAVVLYLLYRILRRPKGPAGESIAMRPGSTPPAAAAPTVAGTGAAAAAVTRKVTPSSAEPAPAAPGARPYLTLAADPERRFDISDERFAIGRAEGNQLRVDESFTEADTVSRYHAAIYRQGGDYVIEDLNSHNGLFVDDVAVPKIALRDGARLSVGAVNLIFHLGADQDRSGGKS